MRQGPLPAVEHKKNSPQRPLLPWQKWKAPKEGDRHSLSPSFVRWLQSGYFALESLHRNGLQISGKKYSQFF